MDGYKKRTNEKKKIIITTAQKFFSERGVLDVSINEIAKSANVSQVSIYNYFGDKNTLAKEAFTSYIEEAIAKFEKIIESKLEFSEKLKCIMQSKNDIIKITSSYFYEQAWEDKVLQQIFQETLIEKTTHLYIGFIEAGKKEGIIDPNIPTDAIMSYLMMSISVLQKSDFHTSSKEFKKGIIDLFLYGLLGKNTLF